MLGEKGVKGSPQQQLYVTQKPFLVVLFPKERLRHSSAFCGDLHYELGHPIFQGFENFGISGMCSGLNFYYTYSVFIFF